MDGMNVRANAEQQLARLKELTRELGLTYVELPPRSLGVGFAVAFGEDDYAIVSIVAFNENAAFVTAGVSKDIDGDSELAALRLCNKIVSDRPDVPVFLHPAERGWDLIAQTSVPVQLFLEVPPYYEALLRDVPETARETRPKLAEAGIAGQSYLWNDRDAERLLARSFI